LVANLPAGANAQFVGRFPGFAVSKRVQPPSNIFASPPEHGRPSPQPGRRLHGDRVLTTTEAAALIGVHQRTLRRYLALGLLAHHRLPGGHYRIPEESILQFWRENERAAPHTGQGHMGTERMPGAPRSDRQTHTRSMPSRRRPLGKESPMPSYDLSSATLAALRARLS
jgi:excisionase family DNA binding protein